MNQKFIPPPYLNQAPPTYQMHQNPKPSAAPLILGILSVCFYLLPLIGLALGIIGIVLSLKARRVSPGSIPTAGFVLSIIGTVLSAIFSLILVAVIMEVLASGWYYFVFESGPVIID